MQKPTYNEVFIMGSQLLLSETLQQISDIIGVSVRQMKELSFEPEYHEFLIPKGNQKFRIIEAPVDILMELQRKFNKFLQAAYYLKQTKAAYGFIMSIKNTKNKKTILQNATRHLSNKYMLKIDLKDFFHQISKKRVYNMFCNPPFEFSNNTSQTLSNLFTYKGRLPMGSPTSPVLSNFACILLDNELLNWATKNEIVFTRFADDMTFSTNTKPFDTKQLQKIVDICSKHNFVLQKKKTKFYNELDIKSVTGLVLNETVDIDIIFYKELNEDITRLRYLVETTIILNNAAHSKTLKKFKQEIQGKINFIGMIEGYRSSIYYEYNKKMKEAMTPQDETLFTRWTHFNYF